MLIENFNANIINSKSFSLHDAILQNLNFDTLKKVLTVQLKIDIKPNLYLEMNFFETIGFNLSSCDFWGNSPHILDFEYIEKKEHQLLSNLEEIKNKLPYHPLCKLNSDKEYWECLFTFSSGDTLRIVCKTLQIRQLGDGLTVRQSGRQSNNQGTAD